MKSKKCQGHKIKIMVKSKIYYFKTSTNGE